MNEYTNYNKARMEELSNEVNTKAMRYNELIESLDQKINEMHNYWVEGDQEAEEIYQELLSQFNHFKEGLNEGYQKMTDFRMRIDNQVEAYRQAESEASAIING